MKQHLNTLFVTLEGAYLRKDGAAVEIRHDGKSKLRVPLHNLDGICCFGWNTTASAALMNACTEADVSLSFHSPHGKLLAAAQGFTSGNILLRRAQYRIADDCSASKAIARNMISAKIANSRNAIQRAARDHGEKSPQKAAILLTASDHLKARLRLLPTAKSLNQIRGIEGEAATLHFAAFNHLITVSDSRLRIARRNRRPPLDPVNALLSFCFVLLMHDCRSALESCGLDSQCGILHRDRPGRPSLALDLMEEFRTYLAERTVLSLINRQQITRHDFVYKENGAVLLKPDSRKTILNHWQERKRSELFHPFLEEKVTLGLLPYLQARLLAKHLRGEIDAYPAFLFK